MWRAIVLAKIGEQPSGALTRRKMMSSAVMLFFEKGYHNTTTVEIARRVGMSNSSFFRAFENKHNNHHTLFFMNEFTRTLECMHLKTFLLNKVKNEGAKAIAGVLKTNTTLLTLNLDHKNNRIVCRLTVNTCSHFCDKELY